MAQYYGLGIDTIPAPLLGESLSSPSYLVPTPSAFVSGALLLGAGLAGRKRYPKKTLAEIAQGH